MPFEVTTLRRDIETFGRHAKVTFTTDWREDAMRRDFTMNALYCDADGTVHDPLGGYGDLKARARALHRRRAPAHPRGLPAHPALLPLWRRSTATRRTPDAEGLAAAVAEKAGLAQLSGERIRAELLLLLARPGAVAGRCDTMRETGLIAPLLGVPGDVELFERLAAIEAAFGRAPDAGAAARGAGVRHARGPAVAKLRLSTAEAARLARRRTPRRRLPTRARDEASRQGLHLSPRRRRPSPTAR